MANKKINQLVAKTTIQSTDLFPIGDATTGTLYKKTIADLQAAIGGAVISVNGLVGTVVLDADDILETATPTNRYFTDSRARAAISLTTSGSSGASTYSSSTGVLNVPTYTLAGLGGITASFLSGGTGITYNSTTGVISYSGTVYTDSSVRALFSGGTGISYNSSTGAISYSGTVYTDASIRALVSAGTGLSYNSTTGVFSYSGTVYTDASIRALFSGTSPITYNSTTGAIGISTGNLTESTSSVLTITGGTGALISSASIQVKQASGSQSGFLSSTDWTTFNSKQNALTNPVTGTGTSGYVTFWNGSGTVTGDAALFWDNTNKRLGIGTNNPGTQLNIVNASPTSSSLDAILDISNNIDSNFRILNTGSNASDKRAAIGSSTGTSLAFHTGNTEKMRITSGGNVGIGTTSPGYPLVISATTANTAFYNTFSSTNNRNWAIAFGISNLGDMAFMQSNAQNGDPISAGTARIIISNTGNVGIGTTSPASRLYVAGGVGSTTSYTLDRNGSDSIYAAFYQQDTLSSTAFAINMQMGTNGGFQFYTFNGSWNERMRITAGGNILLGTTTDNGERLYVSGAIRATGTITANSDITLKKNLAKIENALEKVEQINGYTYEFKTDDSKRHAGVIAQEIQGVLPEIVNKGNDGLLGVEYGNISALLIEAIKDLKSKNELLEARLVALEK